MYHILEVCMNECVIIPCCNALHEFMHLDTPFQLHGSTFPFQYGRGKGVLHHFRVPCD